MDVGVLLPLLDKIHGATFATIDSVTWLANKSIRHEAEGTRVILFRTNGKSGYEGMVKRRLAEAGKDPEAFNVGPLPFGERVDGLPLIKYGDKHYLQCVKISEPLKSAYYIGTTDVEVDPDAFGINKKNKSSQGLSPDKQVEVRMYALDSITHIALMGERVGDEMVANKRSVLRIRANDLP